jgi:hypothetical protein
LSLWLDRSAKPKDIISAVTNLGYRQDVRFLHVHLFKDEPAWMSVNAQPIAKGSRFAQTIQTTAKSISGSKGGSVAISIKNDTWKIAADQSDDESK